MNTETLAVVATNRPFITTEEFASLLALRSQTLRKQFCVNGHYFGVKPIKMPNGRLMWPANALEQLQGAHDV